MVVFRKLSLGFESRVSPNPQPGYPAHFSSPKTWVYGQLKLGFLGLEND